MQTDRSTQYQLGRVAAYLMSALLVACTAATVTPDSATTHPAAAANGSAPLASSAPAAASAPGAASAPSNNGSSAPAPNPNLRPFNDLIKDFKKAEGFFNIWSKDDRYLIELRESDFNRPFFFSIHRSQGLGERWLYPGLLIDSDISVFRKTLGDRVQWFRRNTTYFADGNKPMEHNIEQGFPDSLMGVAPIVSQPNPSTKAVLVDISSLIVTDLPAAGSSLEATFRLGYAFDRGNSQISHVRTVANETNFEVLLHFALGRIPLLQPNQPGYTLPRTVPDPRSVFMKFYYNFTPLPEPMTPRLADPRVGYFTETRWDYRDDISHTPRVRYIKRWRLEKKDESKSEKPADDKGEKSEDKKSEGKSESAGLVEPKQPITFWLDRNIPERYRDAVREGILMWNPAFEQLGFKNAIVVKQQDDKADFDTSDRHHASVRWFIGTDAVLAVGPSEGDPRTGEILDSDIVFSDAWTRTARREYAQEVGNAPGPLSLSAAATKPLLPSHAHEDEQCSYAEQAFAYMQDALDTIVAQGSIAPDGPEADAFVKDTVRITIAHEVGHALGLTHNFRGSQAFTAAQLRDPAFVAANGTSASIMDYVPPNLPLRGEAVGGYHQKVLGAYDKWAIEYGYKQLAAENEATALNEIAARGQSNPWLAYGNDIDAGGVDPDTNLFDLGDDSRDWFLRRLQYAQEQWDWLAKHPKEGIADYDQPRRSFERSLRLMAQSAQTLAKKVGGIRFNRQITGSTPSSFIPVPEFEQREALDTLTHKLFSADSFRIDPLLLQRLPYNHLDRMEGVLGSDSVESQPQVLGMVLGSQLSVLDQLLSDRTTARLLESEMLRTSDKGSLSLAHMLSGLQGAIWQELDKPAAPIGKKAGKAGAAPAATGNINLMRRNLQRAWVVRLTSFMTLRSAPPDVRSLARANAIVLRDKLQAALKAGDLNPETQAHLDENLAAINEALRAFMLKLPG